MYPTRDKTRLGPHQLCSTMSEYIGSPPSHSHPFPSLVGNPYKPFFVTVTGRGVDRRNTPFLIGYSHGSSKGLSRASFPMGSHRHPDLFKKSVWSSKCCGFSILPPQIFVGSLENDQPQSSKRQTLFHHLNDPCNFLGIVFQFFVWFLVQVPCHPWDWYIYLHLPCGYLWLVFFVGKCR